MFCISVNDFTMWRDYARLCLERKILPEEISWNARESSDSLFKHHSDDIVKQPIIHNNIHISKAFLSLAKNVACFRHPQRWSLLYRVAWRLVFEDKQLLNDAIDEDIARLYRMNKSISRDKHKMAAFVRFQQVKCVNTDDGDEYFVAWFEPDHLILPIKAHFFVERFTNMRWSILTPDLCAHWDLQSLQFTRGVKRPSNLHDDLELLWLEYYKNIFNPARLKTKAMQSEMPKKYWHNLPESSLIKTLTKNAQAQTELMIDVKNFTVNKKNQQSRLINNQQTQLRKARINSSSS